MRPSERRENKRLKEGWTAAIVYGAVSLLLANETRSERARDVAAKKTIGSARGPAGGRRRGTAMPIKREEPLCCLFKMAIKSLLLRGEQVDRTCAFRFYEASVAIFQR